MLYQRGGRLYSEDAKETGLLSEVAMDTFEYWTDFYTKYSFPKSASFLNRFRSGEMPIGISYYEMYNTLAVFAPEIRGNWAFYPIPGTATTIYDEKTQQNIDVIDHTSIASGTGAIIIAKNAQEDSDVKYASWEFLKWWTSTNTQASFGKEMEGILGSSARHATANFNAFQQLSWPKADQEQLLKQWGVLTSSIEDYAIVNGEKFPIETDADGKVHLYGVQEIPQIAGSYITGREIENAYRQVINNGYNPREILYEYAGQARGPGAGGEKGQRDPGQTHHRQGGGPDGEAGKKQADGAAHGLRPGALRYCENQK
jgi:ABC-type glycerol-3-phosphate transport system substrate-binding protein